MRPAELSLGTSNFTGKHVMPAALRLPTDTWARILLAPALIFIATSVERNYQTDFWHHLARGQAIAEQGRLLDEDVFTYTVHGKPFQDANWLTQLCYYRLYQLGGLELVQAVNSLTLAAMMGVLVWLCQRACGSWMVASGLGVFAFFGLWQILVIRPQTFSLLLFVLLYAVLQRAEQRRWLLVFPPLVMALWANLHGGFPIGLILIGCFVLAAVVEAGRKQGQDVLANRTAWSFGLCLLICVAATCVNPYGWKVYQYVRTTSAVASSRRIDEWVPPGLDLFIGKVWMASVLLLIGLFAFGRRRPTIREVCLVLCFLPLACSSVRMIAWWLLVSTPILAGLLSDIVTRLTARNETPEEFSPGGAFVCGGLVLIGVFSLPGLEGYNPLLAKVRDTHRVEEDLSRVADHLGDGPHRIFCRFEWGEYFGWSLGPRSTVFMDGRIEIYPDDVWNDYSAVTRGRADWQAILDHYGVDCLVLDRTFNGDLMPQVERSAAWARTEQAGDAVVFRRAGPRP